MSFLVDQVTDPVADLLIGNTELVAYTPMAVLVVAVAAAALAMFAPWGWDR